MYPFTSRTVTDLDCNTSYSFHVKARGDGNPYSLIYGSPSNVVSQTTSVCTSTPTTPTPTTPTPPTNLSLSVESGDDNDLDLAYTQSESPHYYQFELHRSTTQNGTYTLAATVNASSAPADFDDLTRGNWYKARGKNCATSARSGCGDWSAYSTALLLPDSPAPQDSANTWTATLTSGYDSRYSEYGFWGGANGIGTLSPETFDFDGSTHTVLYVIWDQIGRRVQFRVDRCLKSTDFVSLSIGSSTYNISDAVLSYTDVQCQANGALRQRINFNNVTTNPLSSGSTYQVTVGLSGPVTNTPAVKVEADTSEPFIGQSVSLTAQRSLAFGTASSHQWQEWSGSAWTNLASATSSSHVATSSSGGVKTFRVSATNASSVTATSSPVSIRWRPMLVTVESSPDYPNSGAAVTLTATADAPSGVRYQWQQGSGNSWTNLGTPSTSVTRSVSRTTRGTEKFRVQLSHSVVPTLESEPVYVTWDEWGIVSDLLNTLHASTTSDTSYTRDQTDLVSCMNNNRASTSTPSYTSFSYILSRYAGETKTTMEDHCSATSSRMFSTNKSVSRSKLSDLKSSSSATSTMYAALLESAWGRDFEAGLADPDTLKLVSYLGANVDEAGSLQQPVYRSSGASGQSDTLPPGVTLEQSAGLGCLPDGIEQNRLTLNNKLRVLNCLVFATPHSFWVKGSGTRDADLLKGLIDSSTGRYNWLDYGDWECTYSPDGPLPSCLKHDVAYGGLQKIAGANTDVANGTELDEAWNPRNKALADYKFRADISRHGCQDRTLIAIAICRFPSSWIAQVPYFEAVAKSNSKGWAVSTRDVIDFEANPSFINCAQPVVPRAINVGSVTRVGDTLTTAWNWERGYVAAEVTDVAFYVEWDIRTHPYYVTHVVVSSDCTVSGSRWSCEHDFSDFAGTITGVTIYAAPRDWEYGGHGYGGTDNRTGRRFTSFAGPFEFHLD